MKKFRIIDKPKYESVRYTVESYEGYWPYKYWQFKEYFDCIIKAERYIRKQLADNTITYYDKYGNNIL